MTTTKKDDLGVGQAQKQADKEEELGYRGVKVDPLPNSDHSLESGPDSPPITPDDSTRHEQPAANQETTS